MSLVQSLAIATVAVVLCQCASGPATVRQVEIQPGSRALVVLQQKGGQSLTIVNSSSLTEAQAQKARQADPNLKVMPDLAVQHLLDLLGGEEFFTLAAGAPDPEAGTWLTAMIGPTTYVLSGRAARRDPEYVKSYIHHYSECLNRFNATYNSHDSFAASKLTTRDFKRTSQETKAEALRRKGAPKQP